MTWKSIDEKRETHESSPTVVHRCLSLVFGFTAAWAAVSPDPSAAIRKIRLPGRGLKPKPHIRSGAIAVPEPEPEDGLLTVNPKLISK